MASPFYSNKEIVHPIPEVRYRKKHSIAMVPFGSATAINVLKYFQGTPEITTDVIITFNLFILKIITI